MGGNFLMPTLQLDEVSTLDDCPAEQEVLAPCRQVFYPFPTPLTVREGEAVQLWAKHDSAGWAFAPILPT